jgi:PAS domain S-box-containing protein
MRPAPVTGERRGADEDIGVELLLDAGAVLAESLDLHTTLGRVAQLTVPRLADLCVIDLLENDGSIRQVAVAAAQESVAHELAGLRERQSLDPGGEHPVARVIRSGEPELREEMTGEQMRSFADGAEHARFMIDSRYRSAVVAPLLARSRTLGALSVLRLGSSRPYRADDLEVVSELARRAALAIDNARLYSEVRRVEQRLEAILVNIAEAITLTDADERIVFANQAAAELLGAEHPAELVGASTREIMERFLVLDEDGHELGAEHMPRSRVFEGGDAAPLVVRNIVRETGEERWLVARSSPVADPGTSETVFSVNVYEDITEVKRAQLAETFMAEASRVLASSMDYAATLQRIVELAVPRIADWCAVDLLDEDGQIERVAVHHRDPARLALAVRLSEGFRPSMEEHTGVPEVIRTGTPRLHADIPETALAAHARDEEHLRLLRSIGMRAVAIVPLAAPSRTIGALTLATAESRRRLSRADLALAERLGRRAGTAVESARLYTERTHIADILQAALLPDSLPAMEGLEIEALYRAAGELNDVGGDFYDVFAYRSGRWMLAIGDVCGKGPRAAGVTALARHTLRTAAMLGQQPTAMLQTLHQALSRQSAGADMCTACLIAVEPDEGGARLSVALAGHPQPVLVSADGSARLLGEHGTLLGVIDPVLITEVPAELLPGETLVLYTDGLPEAGPTGLRLGEQRVLELCSPAPTMDLASLLGSIERAAVERADGRPRDDIALMGLRVRA